MSSAANSPTSSTGPTNTTSSSSSTEPTTSSSHTITPTRINRPTTAVGAGRRRPGTRNSSHILPLQQEEPSPSVPNDTGEEESVPKLHKAPAIETSPEEVPAEEEVPPRLQTGAVTEGTSPRPCPPATSKDEGTYVVCSSNRAGHVIRLRPTTTSATGGSRRKPSLTSLLTSRGGVLRHQGDQGRQGDTIQGQGDPSEGHPSQDPQSPGLVSIMKRPATTPGLSPSMRAAIAVSASRNSRRHVKVKTRDGKELRTRDSSCESSRASSPEYDKEEGRSRSGSRVSRSALELGNGARLRSASEEGRRHSGGSSGTTRPMASPAKPVTYKLSTIKRTILACRSLVAMGKTSKKEEVPQPQIPGEYRARSARTTSERTSPGGHKLRSKSAVVRREEEDSDIPRDFVYGTESYYEVINRLCRPTVASVARASMKLIRAGGHSTEEPTIINQNVPRQPPPWLTEEYLSRRFLGEQQVTPEEVEEIVLRLCPPMSYRAPEPPTEPPERRLPLRRTTNTRFGIVQSYMWTCGDKMEQTQWDRKTVEITKRNFHAEKGRMERRLAQLGQTGSGGDVMRWSLPVHPRPLAAPCGVNMVSRSLYKTPLYNTV